MSDSPTDPCNRGQWPRICVAFAMAIASALSGWSRVDEARWSEQVRLHDGRVVVLQRQSRAHVSGFPDSRRGGDIDYQIEFPARAIRWQGRAPYAPVSFEVFDGEAYLVLHSATRAFCRHHPGALKATFLHWDGSAWREIAQSQYPLDQGRMNLYRNYWGRSSATDPSGLVTWETKAARDGFEPDAPQTIASYYANPNRICK